MLLARNRNYRLLFSASAISNLGDGISSLAFPWLATLITRDPTLIALVAFATRLPWFLFAIPAGVLTDRMDRQRLMVQADIFRALMTFGVIALIFSAPALPMAEEAGQATTMILALSGMAFLLGTAEVLRDNAAQTALPSIVEKSDLEAANGQIWSVEQVFGQFIGPPLAGFLIAWAVPLPFAVDAVTFALAAWMIWMIAMPARLAPARAGFWREMKEGIVWLLGHRLILSLAVILGLLNAAHTATLTILVLFSQEVLALSAIGHGTLLTAGAAGGVIGGLVAPKIAARLGGTRSLYVALGCFIAGDVLIWLTASVWVVAASLFIGMLGALLWNVVTVSFRQRTIPDDLLGRVNSLYRFFGWGMMPLGALAGGFLVAWVEPGWGREAALRFPFLAASLLNTIAALYVLARIRIPRG